MKKPQNKPDNTGENRNLDGTFKEGVSGNPAGKPPGALSITALIKAELVKVADFKNNNDKKTYIQLFIKRILHDAIAKGDGSIQKEIWHYIDGMPKGSLDLTTKGQKINSFDEAQIKRVAKEVLEAKENE